LNVFLKEVIKIVGMFVVGSFGLFLSNIDIQKLHKICMCIW